MLQSRAAVAQPLDIGVNWNGQGAQNGAAATFFAYVINIGRQTVAHVDHGMEIDKLMQLQRFAHTGREG